NHLHPQKHRRQVLLNFRRHPEVLRLAQEDLPNILVHSERPDPPQFGSENAVDSLDKLPLIAELKVLSELGDQYLPGFLLIVGTGDDSGIIGLQASTGLPIDWLTVNADSLVGIVGLPVLQD